MKANIPPLLPGAFYHVYNRGINGENLFRCDENYHYFLRKYAYHIPPVAETYAYCLLRNHFHLLIRTKEIADFDPATAQHPASKAFADLFNGYAQGVNKVFRRTGGLFETPFRRILIENPDYLIHVVRYIHQNPKRHGFTHSFEDWPFSSYSAFVTDKRTQLLRDKAIEWFSGKSACQLMHTLPGAAETEQHFALEFD